MLNVMTKHAQQRIVERTSISKEELTNIIKRKLYVNLGTKPGLHKSYLLVYSIKDDNYFVLLQDNFNGDIITILTEEYHNNLAMKISDESKRIAKELMENKEPIDDCILIAAAVYIDETGKNRSKQLFKFRTENSIILTKEYFIDNFIKTGKTVEAIIEKGFDPKIITGYSVKDASTYRFFIDIKDCKKL